MNPILIPFVAGLLLGRTIDLTKYDIGSRSPIFAVDKYNEVPVNSFDSKYFVLEDSVPYDFAKIPLDIAIRIKAKNLELENNPLENFIKSTTEQYNPVFVVAVAVHRTVDRTLKSGATPVPDWHKLLRKDQTHYVHGVAYGGAAVAIHEISCSSPTDAKAVKDILHSFLGTEGPLNTLTQEKWDKVTAAIYKNEYLKGRVSPSAQTHSNVALKHPFSSFIEFIKQISNLPQEMKDIGVPLYSQLKPLKDLDSKFPNVVENVQTIKNLKLLDPMMDDVRNSLYSLNTWEKRMTGDEGLDNDFEKKSSALRKKMKTVKNKLSPFSYNADIYTNMDESAFNQASKLYSDTVAKQGGNFYLMYKKLRDDFYAKCQNSFFEKVNGLLVVSGDETVFTGTVKKGLEECKNKCFTTIRCKSIGYTDSTKECRLYSRSTNTAELSTRYKNSEVYDRKCH